MKKCYLSVFLWNKTYLFLRTSKGHPATLRRSLNLLILRQTCVNSSWLKFYWQSDKQRKYEYELNLFSIMLKPIYSISIWHDSKKPFIYIHRKKWNYQCNWCIFETVADILKLPSYGRHGRNFGMLRSQLLVCFSHWYFWT